MSESKCSLCDELKGAAAPDLPCRNCCTRVEQPYIYPDGPLGAELDLAADLDDIGCLYHDKPVKIITSCFYPNSGVQLLHLGEATQIGFTGNPVDRNSDLYVFRFRKYPTIPNSVRDADGNLLYQSRGRCIREGDNLTMDNLAIGKVMTHIGYVSPHNTPFINVPYRDSIEDFTYAGTKSAENIQIISRDYNPALPRNEQPLVRVDGKKQYFIQFTRTSQFLSVVPYQEPAPCLVKTSGYMGDNTAFLFVDTDYATKSRIESQRQLQIEQQRAAAANVNVVAPVPQVGQTVVVADVAPNPSVV